MRGEITRTTIKTLQGKYSRGICEAFEFGSSKKKKKTCFKFSGVLRAIYSTTAQRHSAKYELGFRVSLNPAHGVSDFCDGKKLTIILAGKKV